MSHVCEIDRRSILAAAASIGATALFAGRAKASAQVWREDRQLFPFGVASGDPDATSVILWTRRAFTETGRGSLTVEVALDAGFRRVVSTSHIQCLPEADWTVRALVAGLKPSTVYWYRFIDEGGAGSRVGRTITAPSRDDMQTRRFAFVSCQSVNEGAQNALRRMVWEDQRAAPRDRLGFLLHLGDFIYEVVEYPDEVSHRYDRIVYDIGRIPDARKVGNFHVPTTLDGYRAVYRGHLADPDIQDARAYLPFVCIGDNHEFSWQGWQSFIKYGGKVEPAQALRVAANQAWWEYIPSRVQKASGPDLSAFAGPKVTNGPIENFDDSGLGLEANNIAAIRSMTAYRRFQYGALIDVFLTDLHSYRMEDPTSRHEVSQFGLEEFPGFTPQEAMEALDAGRSYDGARPPEQIEYGEIRIPNFRRNDPPVSVLGVDQKRWLKEAIASSRATWKIWAATNATIEMRVDPQNLPAGLTKAWPGKGYALMGGGDFSGAFTERAELYDHVRDAGVTGFITVSGDRHSFWAGYASSRLPPAQFQPIGLSFVTGSISAPGLLEAFEHNFPKTHPLRPLFLADIPQQSKPDPTINLLLHRGVRSALEYARSHNIDRARSEKNPNVAPHVTFVDMGGHGYSVVKCAEHEITTEFVCVPRPIARATSEDGGPINYRISHRASTWESGARPALQQEVISGDPRFSV